MARSAREIPHYYLASTVDLGPATAWLAERNAARPVAQRLLPAALFVKATAMAAQAVPTLNGFWTDGFEPAAAVHVGMAVSLRGGGLVAPALHHADRLDLDELMTALRDLVGRARAGKLRSSEMSDPTITVTSLGKLGGIASTPVINAPEVAIIGVNKAVERPVVLGGSIAIRRIMNLSSSFDHRFVDGFDAAAMIQALKEKLEHPATIFIQD
jgi:pyruvate dehydrogenase E2 component (dihydrolipoamide acetyltransferase)